MVLEYIGSDWLQTWRATFDCAKEFIWRIKFVLRILYGENTYLAIEYEIGVIKYGDNRVQLENLVNRRDGSIVYMNLDELLKKEEIAIEMEMDN